MNSSTSSFSEHSRFSNFSMESLIETDAHSDGTFWLQKKRETFLTACIPI